MRKTNRMWSCVLGSTLLLAQLWATPSTGDSDSPPLPKLPLLFSLAGGGNSDLFIHEPGNPPRRIAPDSGNENYGRWSPDGSRIAYQSRAQGEPGEIWIMSAQGGQPFNLTQNEAWDVLPAWSPDGSQIAFMSTRGFELGSIGPFPGHVYIVGSDGRQLRQVTRDPLTSSLGPSDWAPDGRELLIARSSDDQIDVFALDVESGRERRLTNTPESEYSAVYSPDGHWIAFHVESDSSAQIAIMRADGTERHLVTKGHGWRYGPRWSPDGQWLTYTASYEQQGAYDVRAVRLADGVEVTLEGTPSDEREAEWKPLATKSKRSQE